MGSKRRWLGWLGIMAMLIWMAVAATRPSPKPAAVVGHEPSASEVGIPYRSDYDQDADVFERCRVDIQYPLHRKRFPTIVWFHGGGLTSGDRSLPEALCRQGVAIVAAGYRLSPAVSSPRFIEDAAAAVAWTYREIEGFGGSRQSIFVAGHSAGGYLASLIGLDKRWLAVHGINADELAGIASLSGQSITHFTIRAERGIPATTAVIDDLAPLFHVRKDAPPLLLLTGDRRLEIMGRFEETAYFCRMLREVGHPAVEFHECTDCDHNEMAEAGYPLLLDFVRRHGERRGR